jgi:hypothetical protein
LSHYFLLKVKQFSTIWAYEKIYGGVWELVRLKTEGQELGETAGTKNRDQSMEPFAQRSLRPNSALCSKFYPWNINHMAVVKFLACLDFERQS